MNAPFIGILVHGEDGYDGCVRFLKCLEMMYPKATLYILTDPFNDAKLTASLFPRGNLCKKVSEDMNWEDEYKAKLYLLQHFFRTQTHATPHGIWYIDVDTCVTGQFPTIPTECSVSLLPLRIRASERKIYGKYSSSFFWVKHKKHVDYLSDMYEQGKSYNVFDALALHAQQELYELHENVNVSWLSMFASDDYPQTIGEKFTLHRNEPGIGIRFCNEPLQSISLPRATKGSSMVGFQSWFEEFTSAYTIHPPITKFRTLLGWGAKRSSLQERPDPSTLNRTQRRAFAKYNAKQGAPNATPVSNPN